MKPITVESLKAALTTRGAKKGRVFTLDLRSPAFGPLAATFGRCTLYDPAGDGWPNRRGRSTTDEATALGWLEDYAEHLERERQLAVARSHGILSVQQAANSYVEHLRDTKGPKHNTTVNRASVVRCHIIPGLGEEALAFLEHERVKTFIDELTVRPSSGPRNGRVPADDDTKAIVLATLRAIYQDSFPGRESVPWGVVSVRGDTAWHERAKAALAGDILGEDNYYTADQLRAILTVALAYDLGLLSDPAKRAKAVPNTAPFIAFMFYTTARKGEAALMRWRHIRLDLGVLYIPGTKTAAAPRWVPIQRALVPWLIYLRALAGGAPGPEDFLFASSPGSKNPPSADTLAGRVEKVLKQANLKRPGERCHILRDSHATAARAAGYDREKLKLWMGHAHSDVLRVYESAEGVAMQLLPGDREYLPELVTEADLEAVLGRPITSKESRRAHLRLVS